MTVATINNGVIQLWGAPNPYGHNGDEYPVIVTGQQSFDPRYYTQPYTLTQTADGVVQAYGSLVPQDLATVQTAKLADLKDDYDEAIQQPVSYTTKAGIMQTFQGDDTAVANLSKMLLAFQGAGATPPGFYWVASDNTQVPFTYADMQGLAQAIGVNALTAFGNLQAKKAAVLAASTSAAVVDITW